MKIFAKFVRISSNILHGLIFRCAKRFSGFRSYENLRIWPLDFWSVTTRLKLIGIVCVFFETVGCLLSDDGRHERLLKSVNNGFRFDK